MKKKILAVSLIVSLVAIAALGATLAYFTDTSTVDNTFTLGNIDIELEEIVANVGGQAQTITEEQEGFAYNTLVPGDSVRKEPYIKNVGNNDAYVMMVLELSDFADFDAAKIGKFAIDGVNFGGDLTGTTLPGNTKWYLVEDETATEGEKTVYRAYLIYGSVLPDGADSKTVAPFTGLTLGTDFTSDDREGLDGFEIGIKAYAIQAENLTVQNAIAELFPSL